MAHRNDQTPVDDTLAAADLARRQGRHRLRIGSRNGHTASQVTSKWTLCFIVMAKMVSSSSTDGGVRAFDLLRLPFESPAWNGSAPIPSTTPLQEDTMMLLGADRIGMGSTSSSQTRAVRKASMILPPGHTVSRVSTHVRWRVFSTGAPTAKK